MSKKLLFLIFFVLVLVLASNVLAYETLYWDNDKGKGDRFWKSGTNWDASRASHLGPPIAGDWVVIETSFGDPCHGPIINADTNAVCLWIDMGYRKPVTEAVLTMTGGTINSVTWLAMGYYQPGNYIFDMSGGDVNLGVGGFTVGWVTDSDGTFNMSSGTFNCTNYLSIGTWRGDGDMNMTGGDVNLAGWFEIGSYDTNLGNGHVDLHGGTLETALLAMGGGGVGTMDFTKGTLIIDGDYRVPNGWLFDPCSDTATDDDPAGYTGTIAILAERGLITAYGTNVGDIITGGPKDGLRAVIILDYDVTNAGQTTITGGAFDPKLASKPQPLFGAGGLSALDTTQISWVAGDNAALHEVYFGTDFNDVNDANTSITLGVYEGNQPLSDVNYPVSPTWDTTYFWRIDEVNVTTWKGTVWNFVTKKAWATKPRPDVNSTGVSPIEVLRWDPGPVVADVNGHYVYFSSDLNDVNDRDPSMLTIVDTNNYTPGDLELNTKYYWAVDEVNLSDDPNIWPSPNWNFKTAAYINVDNFNADANNAAIQAVWRKETDPDAEAKIEVATTPRRGAGKSMMYAYRNAETSGAEANAVTTDLFAGTDWTAKGVEVLVLYFYGRIGNGQEMHVHPGSADYTVDNDQMYVALEDGDANVGIVKYYDIVEGYDMNDIQEPWWHQWNIDLADPCLSAVDMNNVVKVYIGFGGAKTGQTVNGVGWKSGRFDTVWFDDIRLYPPRCRSGLVEHDFTGDCKTNYADVDIMARDWLMYDYNVAAVAISGDPCGWWQFDDGHPSTTAVDSSGYGNDGDIYNKDWVGGYPNDPNDSALHFDADGLATYDRVICAKRDGNNPGTYPGELMPATFTVACWVKVDAFEYYGTFVTDGVDQGTTGNLSSGFYLYCNTANAQGNGPFGLAIATGTSSTNYMQTSSIYNVDTWYHLAGTYNDANKASIYVDGKLVAGPTDVNGPIRWIDPDTNSYPDYFVIGALGDRRGLLYWYYSKASIDDVRVYGYAMPYGEIVKLAEQAPTVYHEVTSPANLYDLEAKLSKIVNFRDYRMLADHWLDDPILWP